MMYKYIRIYNSYKRNIKGDYKEVILAKECMFKVTDDIESVYTSDTIVNNKKVFIIGWNDSDKPLLMFPMIEDRDISFLRILETLESFNKDRVSWVVS